MVLFGIAWFFTLLFQCNPIAFFWNQVYNVFYGQMLYEGNCRSNAVEAGMAYTQAILSAGSDFVLGLLPIWIVWNVAMAKKLKISVAGLLGIGISCVPLPPFSLYELVLTGCVYLTGLESLRL